MDRFKKRIVEALHHDNELFLLRHRGTCPQARGRDAQGPKCLVHQSLPLHCGRSFARFQTRFNQGAKFRRGLPARSIPTCVFQSKIVMDVKVLGKSDDADRLGALQYAAIIDGPGLL